jgi:NTP pyrophosphatase (non-canonical NTP hydrolase)
MVYSKKGIVTMNPKTYLEKAARTDHDDYAPVVERIANEETAKLMHYLLGVGSESGELQNALKRYIAYAKPVDKVNVKEELGDVLWYMARICSLFEWTLEEVMELNINKLEIRFPEKFTEEAALNRNLDKERETLEGKETK